jgi:hypothetical protein
MPKTEQAPQARYERQRQKTVASSKGGKLNKGAVVELMNPKRAYRNGGKVKGRK